MQERRESRKIELPHPWTEEQLDAIEEDILAESPRGATPRFWDDVQVGDELDVITKGPLGLTDFIAFIAVRRRADPAAVRPRRRAAPLPQAPQVGVPRPPHQRAGTGVLGALQRLRRAAAGRPDRLRRRHPAHLLADPLS